jgi:hypothetical protein
MRKLLVLVMMLLLITGTAYAGGEKSCDGGWWSKVANECHKVTHPDQDLDTQAGIGADVVIWQNETEKAKFIEEVTAEYRHDFNNDSDSIYGVVRVNLWDKIKSLFSRD